MSSRNWKKPLPEPGNAVHMLPDFPVYKQETDHTCGPACVRMTLLHLGMDVPERKIARRCLTFPAGTLHWTLLYAFRYYLRKIGYTVNMVENDPDIYCRIIGELAAGRPVPFIFAVIDEFHPPKKVTHYGVVAGINEPAGAISIANPFGRIEEMDLQEWWERFSLYPEHLPPHFKPIVRLGLLKPRTALILKKL
ncbi:MAG: C39 family peptidase [bacterium]